MNVEVAQSERIIRVLVADDSAVMRSVIRQMLEFDPAIRVVAVARDGLNAGQMIVEHDPDVVTLDLEMPVMNGLQALERIMREHPRPVILFSAMTTEGAEATLDGLALGAFDYLGKPTASSVVIARDELIAKVKAAFASRNAAERSGTAPPTQGSRGLPKSKVLPSVICIGSSTGGPAALQRILPKLPADFAVPLLIVQHMPPGFTAPFARRLDHLCQLRVQEACDGQVLGPGIALIGPAGSHMRVERGAAAGLVVRLSFEPEGMLHIPSVDVLMNSTADICGDRAVGVILTGMGCDGAQGMHALYSRGAMTIGQDERSCVVYGMPRACAEQGILQRIVPLDSIPLDLMAMASSSSSLR